MEDPYWPEVLAAQSEIRRMISINRLDLFLTLHGPSWNAPFFIVPMSAEMPPLRRKNLAKFLQVAKATPRIIESLLSGAPPHRRYQYKEPATGRKYPDPRLAAMTDFSWDWIAANAPQHTLALTLETVADTELASPEGLKAQGEDLGVLLYNYFRIHSRE
ncbi:MAG: hypothetical protein ACUVR2_07900 [Anaerolineae bacterium]